MRLINGINVAIHKYRFKKKQMMHTQNDPIYSIGTAARMTGVSVHTLRLYEREGLVRPVKSSGNQRLYSDSDIERVQCIRDAINGEKISIAGIRHIHGMIPCWKIKNCPDEQRIVCKAFTGNGNGGCWTYEHEGNVCSTSECRECPVYQFSSNCKSVKMLVTGNYAELLNI